MGRLRRLLAGLLIISAAALCQLTDTRLAPLDQFQDQISNYLKLRKIVAAHLPKLKPKTSAKDISAARRELTLSLAKARADAVQGSIFMPAVASEIRMLAKGAMSGNDGKRVKNTLKHSEPVQGTVRVNQAYPPGVPLQSMPPTLLMVLPKLPMELEYRLVGRTLLLRDSEANLIIDFLPEAIP